MPAKITGALEQPLVALVWKDAHATATSAYSAHEIPHAPIIITTYGLLLRQDEAGVSVASEICADGTYRGVTFVPTEIVQEVRHLLKPKARRQRSTLAAAKKEDT